MAHTGHAPSNTVIVLSVLILIPLSLVFGLTNRMITRIVTLLRSFIEYLRIYSTFLTIEEVTLGTSPHSITATAWAIAICWYCMELVSCVVPSAFWVHADTSSK
jgi:hypothetical protein